MTRQLTDIAFLFKEYETAKGSEIATAAGTHLGEVIRTLGTGYGTSALEEREHSESQVKGRKHFDNALVIIMRRRLEERQQKASAA
jgi:hypothetical protein